jgi:hypothetical protein
MQVITLGEESFFALIDRVTAHLNEKSEQNWKWINEAEAMRLLDIKSKTTLQNLRDLDLIRYTQPSKKVILYDRDSINTYFEIHANKKF